MFTAYKRPHGYNGELRRGIPPSNHRNRAYHPFSPSGGWAVFILIMPNGEPAAAPCSYHAAKRRGIGTRNWNRLLRGDNTISGSIKLSGLPYVVVS